MENSWNFFADFHKKTVTQFSLMKPNFTKRCAPSLVNFDDELIFITGGYIIDEEQSSARAFCYKISTDEWREAPAMNERRWNHSSCVLGNALYVCCGLGLNDFKCSSIERLVDASCKVG